MKRIGIFYLVSVLMLLALSASADDVQFRAALPGETGAVALTFTLDEADPAVFDNYSGITPPDPQVVPEPSTLVLVGLGIVTLVGWRRFRKD